MGDSILSQAEIDALLNGDSEVKDEPTASVSGESDIRPYDPNTQRRVVRERLQALEIINERFARHFRMGLFNLLRRSPDITVGAIRIQPYHEFARNLPVPTNLNLIHLKPLRGWGWWCSHRVWCLSLWITCLAAMDASRPKWKAASLPIPNSASSTAC